MPVVDASVLVEYVAAGDYFDEVAARILLPGETLWAPHLVDAEVGHVLRRGMLAGEVRAVGGREALERLARIPLRRRPHVDLLQRTWELRQRVSFYDGLYVALAERLELPLLTLDARLGRVRGLRAPVEVIA